MALMTQILPTASKTKNYGHQDDLVSQLATASQRLTAIRAQERTAASKVEALMMRRKIIARNRLEEAMRYAEAIEIACAQARVQLEIDHDRLKMVRILVI